MAEYCEIFKKAFSTILDFLNRLKIHSKAPTRYKKWLRNSKLWLSSIFCYPIFNFANTLNVDLDQFFSVLNWA